MKRILYVALLMAGLISSCSNGAKDKGAEAPDSLRTMDSGNVKALTTTQTNPDSIDIKLIELNKYCIQCYKSYNQLHTDLNNAFDAASTNADKKIISKEITDINTKKVQVLNTMDAENLKRVKQHIAPLNIIMQSFESKITVLEKFSTTLNKVKDWVEKIITVSEFLISKGIIKPSIPEAVAKGT